MKENKKKELYERLVDSYGFSFEKNIFLKSIYSELALDIKNLYVLYSLIKNKKEQAFYFGDVCVTPNEDTLVLNYKAQNIILDRDETKYFLAQTITIFEDILPQGTLVELDIEKIKVPNPSSTRLFVVITKRFLGNETEPFYQYGGELYPTGNYGTGRILLFTPATIKRVVHKGYESEVDNNFVYEIMDEILVNQHRISMGFAEEKEVFRWRTK